MRSEGEAGHGEAGGAALGGLTIVVARLRRLRFTLEAEEGVLEISDGVTRATRIAKLAPGITVPVVVIGRYRRSRASSPCVRDRL